MDILVLHIKILKLFCLWPVERSKSTIVLRTTVIVVTFITALFPTAATIRQFLVNFEDEAVVTDDLIAIMNCFCGFFVYVCFLTKMHDVKKYVEGIKVFLQFCPADVIESTEETVQNYTKWFLTYLITGLGLNSLIPVIGYRSCIQRRPDSDHDPCGLPIRVWFPFDVSTSTFYYYVIFFLVNHTCVHVCGVILITTLSLVAFLMHISAQVHVLKENLVKVFESIQENNENSNLKLEAQLKTCIKYHSAIIKYTDGALGAFQMLLMCHVSLAAIVIGILCYYVIFVESMTDKLRHGLHLGGWMSVLYYTCLKGQTTIEESTAIAEITLRIAWYRAPPKVKKYLILMIMRAQKPLVLRTALGTDISLQTYLKIMKSGYSYFTLLICMVK